MLTMTLAETKAPGHSTYCALRFTRTLQGFLRPGTNPGEDDHIPVVLGEETEARQLAWSFPAAEQGPETPQCNSEQKHPESLWVMWKGHT